MVIRHVKFNMNELAARAAESTSCTLSQCVSVEKLSEGIFNKVFLFTMRDGRQIVGKVPDANAGKAPYTTTSEIATMDFVSRMTTVKYVCLYSNMDSRPEMS